MLGLSKWIRGFSTSAVPDSNTLQHRPVPSVWFPEQDGAGLRKYAFIIDQEGMRGSGSMGFRYRLSHDAETRMR